jgi:hypothetical protein
VITQAFKRALVLLVSICLVSSGIPGNTRAGDARGDADARPAAAEPTAVPAAPSADDHFLRDAVASAGFAAQPPDTVDDDFFLPEETDKKKLYRDIAVFVIAAAFVAFFIIKVFIEKDEEPAEDDGNGKDIPPP